MQNEFDDLIQQISYEWNTEIEKTVNILLNMAGCKRKSNIRDIQIQLLEKGYDLVQCQFQNNPFKMFIYLTNIKNKFIKGFLLEYDVSKGTITKELIKSKTKFEEIIKSK